MKKILTITLTVAAIITFSSCQSTKTTNSKKSNNQSKNAISISADDDYDAEKSIDDKTETVENQTESENKIKSDKIESENTVESINKTETESQIKSETQTEEKNESEVQIEPETQTDSPQSSTQNNSNVSVNKSAELHDKLTPEKPQGFGQKISFSFNTKKRHIEGDNFTLFTKSVNGKMNQQDMLTYYHTKNDMIGFGGNYYAAYYIMFFDEQNYKLLENCYKLYLSDFENHKLERKSHKSFRAYGKIDCTLNWGSLKTSIPNFGSGTAYVGYTFIDNKAFFTIQTKEPFYNEYSEITESAVRDSITVCYYFTKSQMENMLNHTNREYMYNLLCKDMVFSEIEDMDSY